MTEHKVFLSYRRGVDEQAAGRVADSLRDHLGKDAVFLDVEATATMVGLDFHEVLHDWVENCTDFVAVIGPGWIEAMPRLASENDWVRIETAQALARDNVRVIPLLVGGAPMPESRDLPADLAALPRRGGMKLSHANYRADIARLIKAVEALTAEERAKMQAERRVPRLAWMAMGLAALVGAGVLGWNYEEVTHGLQCRFSSEPLLYGC